MMSEHEKEQLTITLAKNIQAIIRWWPLILILFGVVEFSVRATSFYDNNITKKLDKLTEEVEILIDQNKKSEQKIDKLSKQVSQDSSEKVTLKIETDSNRAYTRRIEGLCNNIRRKVVYMTMGEHFYYDAKGVRHVYEVPVK